MKYKIYHHSDTTLSLPCIKEYIHPVEMGFVQYQILWEDSQGFINSRGPFKSLKGAELVLNQMIELERSV